ncbi:putative E3 ubiquitin-protein ligase ARI2 isoform X1 [Canna indica]|uniref:RBR-type E3 ubiquitin transferase n=1 Tax=Canna indica TaxID=4628 RepID=A0AAQ3K0E2_9LILI|nr:putative E3 ubiquitin-protein ligase ARI2 isoform X1 [Canna indica]
MGNDEQCISPRDYYYFEDEEYVSDYDVDYESDYADEPVVVHNSHIVTVITAESLLAAQTAELQMVMDLLFIKEYQARALLIYYRWKIERLYESLDQKGRERLCLEAGVSISDNKDLDILSSSTLITCNVCFEDVSICVATRMDCGHCFCDDCWTENFAVAIKDGKSRIRCMAPRCNIICDEAIVKILLFQRDQKIADRFEKSLLESYVEDNDLVKWCPSVPHCGNAIRVEGDVVCEVECKCGFHFCFNCLQEAHSPCSCQMWKLWVQKCHDESGTADWILVNTKSCPKCHKLVEKNGGCNHVTCKCGQYFCWLCGGATGAEHSINSIDGHKCNRFDKETLENIEGARRRLQGYLHYFGRYKAHTDSLQKESSLKGKIQAIISILENRQSKDRDYSWMVDAFQALSKSRRALSYSYPFAFLMFGDDLCENKMTPMGKASKQFLFEDHQEQLERNVERLSMLLEKKFDEFSDEQILEMKNQVVDLSSIVDQFSMKMHKWIEEDLLESLKPAVHQISPYRSRVIDSA